MHSALKDAYVKMYGYASDSGGIRHALKDVEPSSEDARFMLVASSAFINYLIVKAQKTGLPLSGG